MNVLQTIDEKLAFFLTSLRATSRGKLFIADSPQPGRQYIAHGRSPPTRSHVNCIDKRTAPQPCRMPTIALMTRYPNTRPHAKYIANGTASQPRHIPNSFLMAGHLCPTYLVYRKWRGTPNVPQVEKGSPYFMRTPPT